MLAKRIIPCLDVDKGRVVKGVQFVDIRDAGDPVEVDVLLPRVVPELTSRRLLVMSYEEGARLTEPPSVTRTGVDVGEFIRAVARAYAQQMFIDGVYNADPREPLKRLRPRANRG